MALTCKFSPLRRLTTLKHSSFVNYFTYSQNPNHLSCKTTKWTSPEDAVRVIKSGDKVYIQGTSSVPRKLVPAMVEHAKISGLSSISTYHFYSHGETEYLQKDCEGIFRSSMFFVSPNFRQAVNSGTADYLPIFITDIPLFLHQQPMDVALVQISPPDDRGFCTLGGSVDCTRAAIQTAKYVIGQVNKFQPKTFGDSQLHISHFDALVEGDIDLPELKPKSVTDVEFEIGKLIAHHLIEDGATIQMGIGSLPDAVLQSLRYHRDLGVHTEMFSDGLVDLVRAGCVTNRFKTVVPGKIVSSFTLGTKKLFDFLNDNQSVEMRDISFTNNTGVVASNHKMAAINACIEIDLTGEVAADCIGSYIYSGFGGQVDFLRGAAESLDGKGKPIIALQSQTRKRQPKIVPNLKAGSSVVSTRAHVHYVVTEYGIANLFGKNLSQRAHALIQLAHPDDREELERSAFERFKCIPRP